jgi:3-ketosteroid 9alpha-monooxygenase subunit A
VAWSFDLAARPTPLDYFGRKFVAFRTSDGRAHVLDAFCPHLGAHLGYGGRLEDDVLVCPFHGWTWDRNGCHLEIPYEEGPPRRSSIRKWPVREIGGACLIWYSTDGREPDWEPELLPEDCADDYHPASQQTTIVWERKHLIPQSLVENLGDAAHVKYIHLSKSIPAMETHIDGPKFVSQMKYLFGEDRGSTWLAPEGPRPVTLTATAHGLGYTVSRYGGLHGAVHILGGTPVDPHHSEVWAVALVPKAEDDIGDTLGAWGSRLVKEMFKSHEQDFPVWENMRYIAHPPYARSESPHHASLRRWAAAFYE